MMPIRAQRPNTLIGREHAEPGGQAMRPDTAKGRAIMQGTLLATGTTPPVARDCPLVPAVL